MRNRRSVVAAWGTGLICMLGAFPLDADWDRFRGPNGQGVDGDGKPVPVSWSPTEKLRWKIPLPGAGVSSPIVVGDRVFVTCYSGYGVRRNESGEAEGEMEDLKRHLVCIDRASGKILWDRTVNATLPEDPYSGMGVPSHGYASHTPVSDGKRVYAFFGKSGAVAFDMEGNQLWQTSVGTESDPRAWGSASSPVLAGTKLIVTASAESEALVALDTESGKEIWRKESSGFANVWGTPALIDVDGHQEIVIGVAGEVWGFAPETGKFLWFAEIPSGDQFNSSVVVHDGLVLGVEGRGGGSFAIRAGGTGDVTQTHVAWTGRDNNSFGTPLVLDGRLYFFANKVANCIDAKTGQKIYQERLVPPASSSDSTSSNATPGNASGGTARGSGGSPDGGPGGGRGLGGRGGRGGRSADYASAIADHGHIYYLTGDGTMYVIKSSDKFELVSTNLVTTDRETFAATPALSQGAIYLRSDRHLYCIGE